MKLPGGSGLRRAKGAIDVLASISVVIVTIVLVAPRLQGRNTPTTRHGELTVPSSPLSLEGAALIGDKNAPAAILEFSDFECPYCGAFSTSVLPTIEKEFISTGRLLLAFRHLPLQNHSRADEAATAAICAADQQQFRALHDALFANPKALDDESLLKYAVSAGLDQDLYRSCLVTTGPTRIKADAAFAKSLGVAGTPAFFVGVIDERRQLVVKKAIRGTKPVSEFTALIAEAIASK